MTDNTILKEFNSACNKEKINKFFVDKYKSDLNNFCYFHEDIYKELLQMSKYADIPHIIFHGPFGSGKRSLVNFFLKSIYGETATKYFNTKHYIPKRSKKDPFIIKENSNIVIINAVNSSNCDKYLVQDVIKEFAGRQSATFSTHKKSFRIVLIDNPENLSYYAQTSLRGTIEKYSSHCRFIMISRNISNVIEPLKSRCFNFRISAPKPSELLYLLNVVSLKEDIAISEKDQMKIVKKADRNAKKALWLLELKKFDCELELPYHKIIKETVSNIINITDNNSKGKIKKIRDLIYNLFITNIEFKKVFIDITNLLLASKIISDKCKKKIIFLTAKYETLLNKSSRKIIPTDAFVIELIDVTFSDRKEHGKIKKTKKKNIFQDT